MRTVLNDKLITELIDRLGGCNKRDINKYIAEVAERCAQLCVSGEHLRVLNEYKFMIENLCKIAGL